MDTLTIIIIFMLIGAATWLVIGPMLTRQSARTDPNSRLFETPDEVPISDTIMDLQAKYQGALQLIRDLDFDYDMGKIGPEDYEQVKAQTKLEAADLRRRIDQLQAQLDNEPDDTLAAEVEKLVTELRQNLPPADDPLLAEVEAEIGQLKQAPALITEAACANCGKAAQPDDRFCSGCGQPVKLVTPPPPTGEKCPECGATTLPGDLFCANCGTGLPTAQLHSPTLEDARI